jgi:hypothetical protein
MQHLSLRLKRIVTKSRYVVDAVGDVGVGAAARRATVQWLVGITRQAISRLAGVTSMKKSTKSATATMSGRNPIALSFHRVMCWLTMMKLAQSRMWMQNWIQKMPSAMENQSDAPAADGDAVVAADAIVNEPMRPRRQPPTV